MNSRRVHWLRDWNRADLDRSWCGLRSSNKKAHHMILDNLRTGLTCKRCRYIYLKAV